MRRSLDWTLVKKSWVKISPYIRVNKEGISRVQICVTISTYMRKCANELSTCLQCKVLLLRVACGSIWVGVYQRFSRTVYISNSSLVDDFDYSFYAFIACFMYCTYC
jgi:hypothetical protein